jgi:hypothetical protein
MKRAIAILAGFCALVAAAVGALAMSMAWQHNPQGAFHESVGDGGQVIHWGSWGLIGLSWFVIVFLPLSLVGAGAVALSYHLETRRAAG